MGIVFDKAEIVRNFEVSNGYWIVEMLTPDIAPRSLPGQFVMMSFADSGYDPLLPRAFSMARRTEKTLVFIYKVIGKGTEILSRLSPGDSLNIWGPLGNGFTVIEGNNVLIGGGTGIAPLIDLAEELAKKGVEYTLVCGGRTAGDLKFMDEFTGIVDYLPYTEDGTLGEKGYVTEYITDGGLDGATIYSCGPMPMLRRVAELSLERGIAAQLSIETTMGCGLGTCLGCAVPKRNAPGYFKACTDGPVFSAEEARI